MIFRSFYAIQELCFTVLKARSLKRYMKALSIRELREIIRALFVEPGQAEQVCTGISTDSRTATPGDCFFAITGVNFDGHDYIANAFNKGAICAIVSKNVNAEAFSDKSLLKVTDTVEALGDLARWYRRQAGFKVVAITGSVGKTTTKQIIYHILRHSFKVHQSPRSFNNNIGLPLTLLGADPETKIVVAELGSNHPGEIAQLTRIASPNIAVVTNVYPAHLEGFGNLDTITREKLSISEGLGPDGILLINGDLDFLTETCRNKGIKFLSFGITKDSDYHLSNIQKETLTSRFEIDGEEILLPLPGKGNIENALAAWAVCSLLDVNIKDFAEALKTIPSVSMRAELLHLGTLTVLSDCYNANPASMKNALEILSGIDPAGTRRRVFVCGDMAELGGQTGRLHAELGEQIAWAKVDLLVAVGEFSKIAADSAKMAAGDALEIKSYKDALNACNNLHEFVKDYDIILVKGSRAASLETVVEKLKELFSPSESTRSEL